MRGASPRQGLILEPLQNPPTVNNKSATSANKKNDPQGSNSKTNLLATDGQVAPSSPPKQQIVNDDEPAKVNHEENNVKWTPLIDKTEKLNAKEYGYSFGSKKVAMGPGFVNLRFLCHCLARAIKRHVEFSQGTHWFLQDLQKEEEVDDLEFSYKLPADLRLTLNPKGVRVNPSGGDDQDDDDEDDINPF